MADQSASRFAPQNKSTHERLSTNTVGLVAFSDYRKRRAEVLEQQDRESREAASGAATPTPGTSTPDSGAASDSGPAGQDAPEPASKRPKKKKKANRGKKLLSFDDDDGDDDGEGDGENGDGRPPSNGKPAAKEGDGDHDKKSKLKANTSVSVLPRAMTKAALRKEAAEREALRREFLAIQEAVKATEIALPFVFYDGTDIPGGTVRVKKGDFTWVFLDKSRKVGAELEVGGEKRTARKNWARVGVDDLMLVRGNIIIPHHYDFYYFIVNKTVGPDGQPLFDYSAEAPTKPDTTSLQQGLAPAHQALPDVSTLEGASHDPTLTKVVDRRWYQRNKHIYPASTWQTFDAETDYSSEVRRDTGGNTFFFSR